MILRLLIAFALIAAAADDASAQRRRKRKNLTQRYEARVDLDIGVATQSNSSLFDVQLSWFADTPMNGADPVHPQLRRHVLHPNELYARATHEGSTLDTRTGVYLGGTYNLGPVFGRAQAGVEHDDVSYDPLEGTYRTTPVQAELGVRPAPILALSVYGKWRPIIDSTAGGTTSGYSAKREGMEAEAGGRIAFSTPNDALFTSLAVWWHLADWDFTGLINAGEDSTDGPMSAEGLRAALQVTWQATMTVSWLFRAEASREYWDNDRLSQDLLDFDPPYEDWVYGLHASGGFVYWHDARMGFRAVFGGGYDSKRPHYDGEERATISFGMGVTYRF